MVLMKWLTHWVIDTGFRVPWLWWAWTLIYGSTCLNADPRIGVSCNQNITNQGGISCPFFLDPGFFFFSPFMGGPWFLFSRHLWKFSMFQLSTTLFCSSQRAPEHSTRRMNITCLRLQNSEGRSVYCCVGQIQFSLVRKCQPITGTATGSFWNVWSQSLVPWSSSGCGNP